MKVPSWSIRRSTSGFLMVSGALPSTSTWITRVPVRRESAMRKPWIGALLSKNCAPRLLLVSSRVTPTRASTMSTENTQRMGRSRPLRTMRASFSRIGSKYSSRFSRSVWRADGGDISTRIAGMKVISTVSAARMPKAVHRPKFLIEGSPNVASEPKLSDAMVPAASMTTPTLTVASMTASRLCSAGDSSGRALAQAAVLLVVALEDLHRMAGADRQQQDGRHDVPGIHGRADEPHQPERPDDAHDRGDQRNDHALQRAEGAVVQVADHRQRQHEEHGHAPRVDEQPVENRGRPRRKNLQPGRRARARRCPRVLA